MNRQKWLRLRQTVRQRKKQQGPRKGSRRAKRVLTAFSSFRKLARLIAQDKLPQDRAGTIMRALQNAAKRAA